MMTEIQLIRNELRRAKEKHPNFPTNIYEQVAIISEEAGEVAKAALHLEHENGTLEDLKSELVQTAAMCIRMLENLE